MGTGQFAVKMPQHLGRDLLIARRRSSDAGQADLKAKPPRSAAPGTDEGREGVWSTRPAAYTSCRWRRIRSVEQANIGKTYDFVRQRDRIRSGPGGHRCGPLPLPARRAADRFLITKRAGFQRPDPLFGCD